MESSPGYLLKKFLLYTYFFATIAFPTAIFKDRIGIGDDGIRWPGFDPITFNSVKIQTIGGKVYLRE